MRPFLISLLASSAVAIALAGCAPKNPDATATVTTPQSAVTPTGAVAPAAASVVDDKTKSFVEKAAITDMFEVEAGKIALTRSKVGPIKAFAQMMIDDHSATTKNLEPLATAAGVVPPSALDNDHLSKLDDLQKIKDADFDKKYLDQQESAHSDALNLMKDYAQNGKNPGIQAFAIKVSGKVEEHLQKAKALQKSGLATITKVNKN